MRGRLIFVLTLHVRKTGREKQGESARITLSFLPFKPAGGLVPPAIKPLNLRVVRMLKS